MTFQWYNILAADDGEWINILVLVVMGVIALVGHVVKKAQEKKQVEDAGHKVEQAKRRHAAAHASPERAQTKPPPVPVIHPAATLGQGVGREVVQVRKQLATKERQQQQRLAPMKPLQPVIGPKAASVEGAFSGGLKIHLNLTSPKAAKTAIICAEVLGLPKSLRTNPEPWDM